jgi:hypothetical protein
MVLEQKWSLSIQGNAWNSLGLPSSSLFVVACPLVLENGCGVGVRVEGDLQMEWSGWNSKRNLLILSSGLCQLQCASLQTWNTNISGKYWDSLKYLSYHLAQNYVGTWVILLFMTFLKMKYRHVRHTIFRCLYYVTFQWIPKN